MDRERPPEERYNAVIERKFRSERLEQANRMPLPIHRWFFPVLFTALFFGLFGDFVREAGNRLRFIFFG